MPLTRLRYASSGDGQFIFGAFETFPLSSGLFLILGIVIDYIKNKKTVANKVYSQ
jgi:hypothetical protein